MYGSGIKRTEFSVFPVHGLFVGVEIEFRVILISLIG